MTITRVNLDSHKRGDTFRCSTTLSGDWTASDFTGGLRMVFRTSVPPSTETTDDAAVDVASTTGGEITADGTDVSIEIPASRTTSWPAKKLLWELQGVISGEEPEVHTLAEGTILITPDIARAL